MFWIRHSFTINRTDALLFFAAAWALIVAYVHGGGLALPDRLWFLLLACSAWAIGAAVGCRQISWGRAAWLALIQLAAAVASYRGLEIQIAFDATGQLSNPLGKYLVLGAQWFVIAIGSAGLHWTIGLLVAWLKKKIGGADISGGSRFEVLLSITLLMLVGHWIATQEISVVQRIENFEWMVLLVLALVSYLLANALTGKWSWIFALIVLPAFGLVLFFRSYYEVQTIGLILVALVGVVSLIAAGAGRSRQSTEETERSPEVKAAGLPSFWGLAAAAIFLLFSASPHFVNVPTLIRRDKLDLRMRWEYAKSAGEVIRSMQAVPTWNEHLLVLNLDFADSRIKNDVLPATMKQVAAGKITIPPYCFFQLSNIHPEVKTDTTLTGGWLTIRKGTISGKQLSELASSGYLELNEISFAPGSEVVINGNDISISNCSSTQLRQFFAQFAPTSRLKVLMLNIPLTEEYWPIIWENHQQFSFRGLQMEPREFLRMIDSFPEPATNLFYEPAFSVQDLAEFPKILDSDLPVRVAFDNSHPLSIIEASLLINGALPTAIMEGFSGMDWSTDRLLVYKRFDSGAPQAVFLPILQDWTELADELQGLESIETLSLDCSWMSGDTSRWNKWGPAEFKLDSFSTLTNLKQLFFHPLTNKLDIEPFQQLNSLQDLQISANLLNSIHDLEAWQSLQTLTLFVQNPDFLAERTAVKLPNLQKLQIVCIGFDPDETRRVVALAFPEFPDAQIGFSDYVHEVPDSFTRHLQDVKTALKEKLKRSREGRHWD